MRSRWERIISANMEAIQVAGRNAPIFRPRHGGFVWVMTGAGEVPAPPPNMERQDMATRGGRELEIDASDPDFLLLHKTMGVMEYTHTIPWAAITDIVFVITQVQ